MWQGLLFPTSGFSCLLKSNRRLPPLIRSDQELQTLSPSSLEICLSSLQSESLDESVTDVHVIPPVLLEFSMQVFEVQIPRPSLVMTRNDDVLRLNGVTLLHKYLNIRPTIFKNTLKTQSNISNEPRILKACWTLLIQQEIPISQPENS